MQEALIKDALFRCSFVSSQMCRDCPMLKEVCDDARCRGFLAEEALNLLNEKDSRILELETKLSKLLIYKEADNV